MLDSMRRCGPDSRTSSGDRTNPKADQLKIYGRSVGRLHVIFLNYTVTEPWRTDSAEEGTGSCWFVRLPGERSDTPARYLMTCNHCVERSMEFNGIYIQTSLTQIKKIPARLAIAIPEIDAAIVELLPMNGVDPSQFRVLELGDDRYLESGDGVQVYGYPMSQDKLKMSESKITGREDGLLMLDGSINYGHSGGPVIHEEKVVGWITMGMPQANAISFAQPISYLKAVMSALIPPPEGALILRRGNLGVKYFNGSDDRLESVGARKPREPESRAQSSPYSNLGGESSTEGMCSTEKRLNLGDGARYSPFGFHNTVKCMTNLHGSGASRGCESGVVIQWVSKYSDLKNEPFNAEPGDILCSITAPLELDGEVHYHRFNLDNTGQVNVPWMDDKVDLSVVLILVPIHMPVGVDIWRSRERRLISSEVRLKAVQKNGYFMPYYPYERTRYEIFGGIIVAEMNEDVLNEFQRLSLCLDNDEKEAPKLVVVKVYLGSPLDTYRNISEGEIVKHVNGYSVTDIDGYRAALLRPIEGRFLSIVTKKNRGDVVRMEELLSSEENLAQQYGYPYSETFTRYLDSMRKEGHMDRSDSMRARYLG